MANKQNTVNYTHLYETYGYKFNELISDRLNFYQYSKNNENSIDDPIFTGFTFDIDMNTSPLFHNGSGDSYTSDFESLRSNDGDDTSLAQKIETYMTKIYKNAVIGAPNTYELYTTNAKDWIMNDAVKAGYGLQENVYMDNILYGATEYIYMVDKVTEGMYNDSTGTDYVGNGTPNSSIYDDYNDIGDDAQIGSTVISSPTVSNTHVNEMDCPAELDEDTNTYQYNIAQKIEDVKASISDDVISQHQKNLDAVDNAQKNYDDAKSEYDSLTEEKQELNASVSNEQSTLTSELEEYQRQMKSALTQLENNSTDASIQSKIYDIYMQFSNYSSAISSKSNLTTCTASISEGKTDEDMSEYEKFANIVINATLSVGRSTETQNRLDNIQSQISAKAIEMYGSNSNGEPNQQYNHTDDSLYGILQSANDTLNKDAYTYAETQLQGLIDTQNNFADTASYNEYTEGKRTSSEKQIKSVDPSNYTSTEEYNKAEEQNRYSRQSYEVPQTVYDILGFISGMKKLTYEYPYIMQTITGLDDAYKKYFALKDPYMGSGDDKITIGCYESLDLRVSSMFNKYLNAAYDRQYRRERLPLNLRRFNCSVFVHDIRNFRHALGSKFKENTDGDNPASLIVEMALNYVSAIEFKFYDCEIVPEETGNIFDTISNESAGDMRRTNFTFTYGNCVINFLPFEDLARYYNSSKSTYDYVPEDFIGNANIDSKTTQTDRIYGIGNTADVDEILYMENGDLGNLNPPDVILDRVTRGLSASMGVPPEEIREEFGLPESIGDYEPFSAGPDRPENDRRGKDNSYGVTGLGNVYNDNSTGNVVEDLGDIDGNYNENGTVNEIGDLFGDVPADGITDEIGKITGDGQNKGVKTEIGDLFGDVPSNGTTDEIGDLFGDVPANGTTDEIGDLFGDVPVDDVTTEIGMIDGGGINNGVKTEIGDLFDDVPANGVTTEIGDLVIDNSTSSIETEIGQIDMTSESTGTVSKIGDLITDTSKGTMKTEIGKVEGSVTSSSMVSKIGDLIDENYTGVVTTEIDQIDGYGKYEYEMVDDLGDVQMKDFAGTDTDDLGKIDNSVRQTSQSVDDLGDIK